LPGRAAVTTSSRASGSRRAETSPGCMTISWAARTNFDADKVAAGGVPGPVAPNGAPDHGRLNRAFPGPGGALSWPARRASASSSTWARASRPWTTFTRSPSRPPGRPGVVLCRHIRRGSAVLHSRAILAGKRPGDSRSRPNPAQPAVHPGTILACAALLDLSQADRAAAGRDPPLPARRPQTRTPALWWPSLRDALAPRQAIVVDQPWHYRRPARACRRGHGALRPDPPPTSSRASHAEILRFFDGLDLIEPGLVHVPPVGGPDNPRDAEHAERIAAYGGAGRKL